MLPSPPSSLFLCTALLCACAAETGESSGAEAPSASESAPDASVIEVTAVYDAAADQHLFRVSADTVPAGWSTFRFTNASPVMHFVFLDHLPGDRTSTELMAEVSPVFQEAADLMRDGRAEESAASFEKLPEWFGALVFRGGPGLTSPGEAVETTLYLEPGNYVLECYVKTAEGVFHWNLGMHEDLHVTAASADSEPPAAPTLELTLTDAGLSVEGAPTAGQHLVAVHFQEETPGLVGKDVHVARIGPETDVDEIVRWVDFNRPEGLVSTADRPGPAEFVGGVHEMPLGNTAYFRLTLEPGEYLWISEQPVEGAVYERFTVPPVGGS